MGLEFDLSAMQCQIDSKCALWILSADNLQNAAMLHGSEFECVQSAMCSKTPKCCWTHNGVDFASELHTIMPGRLDKAGLYWQECTWEWFAAG